MICSLVVRLSLENVCASAKLFFADACKSLLGFIAASNSAGISAVHIKWFQHAASEAILTLQCNEDACL